MTLDQEPEGPRAERERRRADRERRRAERERLPAHGRRSSGGRIPARALALAVAAVVLAATTVLALGTGLWRSGASPSDGTTSRAGAERGSARLPAARPRGGGVDAADGSSGHLPAQPSDVRGAAARRAVIPVLMYHVIATPRPGEAYPELWVAPARFRSEMRRLRGAGYHAVTLARADAAWRHGGPLPRRPVVVSFDDGYLSHATVARPALRRLGWPGVLNLKLGNLGPGGITTHEVRSLIRDGWEIDSHTIHHQDLTTLGDADLRAELVDSRRELRRRFGVPADYFCYPAGRFDARVVSAVRAAGYKAATTTIEGYATRRDRFELPRIRVNASDDADSVMGKLAAARPAA